MLTPGEISLNKVKRIYKEASVEQIMSSHPFIDIQCKKCADGTAGSLYVQVFETPAITNANKKDKNLPKYGFHLGAVCPQCGKFIAHLPQTSAIVGKKFILIPE